MRRCLYLLALCCLLAPLGWGQQLLWQRRWPSVLPDYLYDMTKVSDSQLLAIGTLGNTPGVMLLGLTADGDTLYRRHIVMPFTYVGAMRVVALSTGEVFVAASSTSDTLYLARVRPEDGSLYWITGLPGTGVFNSGPGVADLIEGPSHSIVLAGSCLPPGGTGGNAGYLACYDTLGTLQWDTIIREHPTNTFCHHVEMTRDGNILVSGTAGSRIWAAEYAQDGFEIRRATFYQSQGRINFDYNPTVSARQAPGDRYFVSGLMQGSSGASYLGLHQGWAGPRVWGGERTTVTSWPAQVNTDGTLVVFQGRSMMPWLVRMRPDSSELWRSNALLYQGARAFLNGYSALPDSSAIAVGRLQFQGSAAEDWYAARITGMGVPYRPWQPAVATRPQANPPVPRPYPSPCSGSLRFAGLAGPCRLQIYGTDGRLVQEQALAPGQTVDVSALPPRVYGYVLQGPGKVWRGRVVKR